MKPYTQASAEADLASATALGDEETVVMLAAIIDGLDEARRSRITLATAALGRAALWYAEQGLHVFPLRPRSKVPYASSSGFKAATTLPGPICEWWGREPEANIGIATGHLVDVIDFDGETGHIAWGQAFADYRPTVLGTVSTPRAGGLHLYVAATGEGNHAAMVPGVDYRGLGGYVVAPPSSTEAGSYRWLRPLNLGEQA